MQHTLASQCYRCCCLDPCRCGLEQTLRTCGKQASKEQLCHILQAYYQALAAALERHLVSSLGAGWLPRHDVFTYACALLHTNELSQIFWGSPTQNPSPPNTTATATPYMAYLIFLWWRVPGSLHRLRCLVLFSHWSAV